MRYLIAAFLTGACLGCAPTAEDPPAKPARTFVADATSWVTTYDPQRAANGYTLMFYDRRIPILVDMNGRVVHHWPRAETKTRLRLLEDGTLLALDRTGGAVEYDWDGNKVWSYQPEGGFCHHDLIRLANGNNLLLVRYQETTTDVLLEVDRRGQVVWEWRSAEHLGSFLERSAAKPPRSLTHGNSVHELATNRWEQAGDSRFRPGNLLLSFRELSLIAVIDRDTGEVAWLFDQELDHQHEAVMIPADFPQAGNILLFDNGKTNRYRYRKSRVLEIDPAGTVHWSYTDEGFFSRVGSSVQPLANGNVLICSNGGLRMFEMTRDHDIVWQLVLPFRPYRPQRYEFDHAPQLAALRRAESRPVTDDSGARYYDRDVYSPARKSVAERVEIGGRSHNVLKQSSKCFEPFVPPNTTVRFDYVLDSPAIGEAGLEHYAARFVVRLDGEHLDAPITVIDDELSVAADSPIEWRQETVDLADHAQRRLEICLTASESGSQRQPAATEIALWKMPRIRITGEKKAERVEVLEALVVEPSVAEVEANAAHLRALGYVE